MCAGYKSGVKKKEAKCAEGKCKEGRCAGYRGGVRNDAGVPQAATTGKEEAKDKQKPAIKWE
ncbi:MAG: hypothetical protein HY099_01735 [Nitrospirae bacterium]|nr:hypothetical protein [Nitrospirota bacterium]